MDKLIVRELGLVDYTNVWQQMIRFTETRDKSCCDECWCVEHPPVFTLGLSGKEEHILKRSNIPVVQSDRGGQVTYHGPGQLVVYLLIDLKRKNITVKSYVHKLEQLLINWFAAKQIITSRKDNAPGIYIKDKKIASLGIRIKRGCSYHGIALNVDMDLTPFNYINPCGFPGLSMTRMSDLGYKSDTATVFEELLPFILNEFNYTHTEKLSGKTEEHRAA